MLARMLRNWRERRAVDVDNVTKRRCIRTQIRAREMDQKVKMPNDKMDNLSLIPGKYMVEGVS